MSNEIKEIEIRIHSQNGDDRRIVPVVDAIGILTEQVKKYGKWIYVGQDRFRLDPNSEESVGALQDVLDETSSTVHVTGSLRGGAPKVDHDSLMEKTLPELREFGTSLGLKSISRTSKGDLVRMILGASKKKTSTKPAPKPEPISLSVSDMDPYSLVNASDTLLVAVVGNPGEIKVGVSKKDIVNLKNEIASLIVEILK